MHLFSQSRINGWRCYFHPVILLLFTILFSTTAFAKNTDQIALLLENGKGEILLAVPMADGEEFAIRYRHSVALTPVTDYFIIKNGEIWLDKTVYQDFGAGLPHMPEEGQKMTQSHGQLMIGGYARRLPTFQLRVGHVANHVLLLFEGGHAGKDKVTEEIPLDSLEKPGKALTFSIGQIVESEKQ